MFISKANYPKTKQHAWCSSLDWLITSGTLLVWRSLDRLVMSGTLLVLRFLDRLVMSGTLLTLLFSIDHWRLRLKRLHVASPQYVVGEMVQ